MCKEFSSIAIQTDDFGCENGCTSMFFNPEFCNFHNISDIQVEVNVNGDSCISTENNSECYIKKESSDFSGNKLKELSELDMGTVVVNIEGRLDCINTSNTLVQKHTESEQTLVNNEAPSFLQHDSIVSIKIEPNLDEDNDFYNTEDEQELNGKTDATPLMSEKLVESDLSFRNLSNVTQGNGKYLPGENGDESEKGQLVKEGVSYNTSSLLTHSVNKSRKINSKTPGTNGSSVQKGTSLTCSYCAKQFQKKAYLIRHVRVHTGEKPFVCSQCPKKFSGKNALNYHLKVHNNEKPFQCSHCELKFRDKASLNNHLKRHTGDDLFECSQCSKTFTTKSHLQRHFKVHTGERPFECSDCERRFSDKYELKRHRVVHSGEKWFECSYCGKTFARKKDAIEHERIHSGEKPYKCAHCDKNFIRQQHLQSHILTHTGKRPHECTHCGKTFAQKSGLTIHLRIHSGEKPHQCTHCEKKFADRGTLRRHLSIHTGKKSSECPFCKKRFSRENYLKLHLQTHKEDRPVFECTYCQKKFTMKRNMTCHILRMHSNHNETTK